jgi:AcrR family transcriptional regulator
MTQRSPAANTMNTMSKNSQTSTQRERMLAGIVTATNRDGYARMNVSSVIAVAGVSRRTFYEHFTDKDDCFLAALADVQDRLTTEVSHAVDDEHPQHAMRATVRALVRFTSTQPAMARFLTNEAMAGGPAALDARDLGIAAIETMIERSYHASGTAGLVPDFSSRILLGGIYRLLAARLRRGEAGHPHVLKRLLGWIGSYEGPAGEGRWRTLEPAHTPPPSPFIPEAPLSAPAPLPRGRRRISEQQVAENQRERIMFAAAQIAEVKGYAATTVGEITRAAGVDGRVFYSMFADKHDAFMAVHEFGFQHVMHVTASAFFSGATWPERNWEAGRAFTQFLQMNPLIAHVGFVEAYAVGPLAAQRLEDSQIAFTMLLREGHQHSGEKRPSRLVLEAIIATIFETVYDRARDGEKPELAELLPHLTFLVLSPFIGRVQANAFIDHKIGRRRGSGKR